MSWFVREPVARFLSVYRHFSDPQRARSAPMHTANSDGRLFESIETFAERALNWFAWDKHIARQTGWGAECAHIIAPLERSAEVVLPVPFPRVNATRLGVSMHEVPQSVHDFYADDFLYWKKISADFNSKDVQASRPHLEGEARR